MKKFLYSSMVLGALALGIGVSSTQYRLGLDSPNVVYALDNFGSNEEESNSQDSNTTNNQDTVTDTQEGNSVSDQLKGWKPVKNEDMQRARQSSAWFVDLVGVAISFILIGVFALVGFITALDILYLTVPFVRSYLYTAGTDGAGGMSGMNMSGNQSLGGRQWVSDEAVQVASMLGGSAQATGHAPGGMGMGVPYGMPGGGMPGAQNPASQQSAGKVGLGVYMRKRVVFLVFLGIASVLLFTSAFTDFGINVGGFILELLGMLSEKFKGISLG